MTYKNACSLVVAILLAGLSVAPVSAQSVYDFVVDPDQSSLSIDFSVSYDGDPWIESDDSSSVQGAWQAEYTPGTGDLDTVSIRNGAIVLNDDLTVHGSEKIAVIEISIDATLRNARLEFVKPSDDADIDANGDAFLTGHKLRMTGTLDYGWRIECDFGTTESDEDTFDIDVEMPAPTDYRTTPHTGVAVGQEVTGAFDCDVAETFTCNLFWLLDIHYDIVAKAIVPGGASPAGGLPDAAFTTAQSAPIQCDGHFFASAFNYKVAQTVNWVDSYGDRDLLYNLPPGSWTGILLYDYQSGVFAAAQYLLR